MSNLHKITIGTHRLEVWRVHVTPRFRLLPAQSGPQRWSRAVAVRGLGIVRLRLGMSPRVLAAERAREATRAS